MRVQLHGANASLEDAVQRLVAALKALVEELDERSPAPVYIEVSADEGFQLSDDVALAIFRITQEALHNAIQHADASEIAAREAEFLPEFYEADDCVRRALQIARGASKPVDKCPRRWCDRRRR